jgi:hypothetical protein
MNIRREKHACLFTTQKKQPTKNRMITTKKTLPHLYGAWCVFTSAILVLGGIQSARAFTASDANLAWSAWKNSFYYLNSAGTEGQFKVRLSDVGTTSSFWRSAEMIEMIADKGDSVMMAKACAGFMDLHGDGSQGWPGNTYNDDLGWASIAFCRAYNLTGNTAKPLAKPRLIRCIVAAGIPSTAAFGGTRPNRRNRRAPRVRPALPPI